LSFPDYHTIIPSIRVKEKDAHRVIMSASFIIIKLVF